MVEYERRGEAYKAIHSALSSLACPPPGKKITGMQFTWDATGNVETVKFYDNAELLFTLTFEWNADDTLKKVTRS
jgi:hypothetical protein